MKTTILFAAVLFTSCSFDCEKYFEDKKSEEMKGIITKFSVDGRLISLGFQYLDGGEHIDRLVSINELYTNKDRIHVGDTLIKEIGKLRWFVHGKNGVDTLYTKCGGRSNEEIIALEDTNN